MSILIPTSLPKYQIGDKIKCRHGFIHTISKPIWGGPHGRTEWFYDTRYDILQGLNTQGSPWESEIIEKDPICPLVKFWYNKFIINMNSRKTSVEKNK